MDLSQFGYNSATNETNFNADSLSVTNLIVQDVTLKGITPNSVLVTNSSYKMDAITLNPNSLLMGSVISTPIAGTLTAGSGIALTNHPTSIDIRSTLTDNLSPNTTVISDASNNLKSLPMTNGQLLIGSTGTVPAVTSLGTGSSIVATTGAGTLSVDTVQPITTTSTPTFQTVKINNGINNALARYNSNLELDYLFMTSNGQIPIGSSTGQIYAATISSGSNINVTNGAGAITVGTVTSPNFTNVNLSALTASSLVATDASNNLQSVTISNSNGCNSSFAGSTLTQSMTQDLTISGIPRFAGLGIGNTGASGQIRFPQATAEKVIYYPGGGGATDNYSCGVASSTMWYNCSTAAVHEHRVGSTAKTRLSTSAFYPVTSGSYNLGIASTNVFNNVYSNNLYGTLQTAAQTNITSLGTLSSLDVTGSINNAALTASMPVKTDALQNLIASAIVLSGTDVSGVLPVSKLGISAGSNITIDPSGVIAATTPSTFANITITNASNQIAMGSGTTITTLTTSATANRTLTFPNITDTLITKTSSDFLTNKSLLTGSCRLLDSTDNSKQAYWDLSTATTGTQYNMVFPQTATRYITFPDISDTLTTKTSTDNFQNKNLLDGNCYIVNSGNTTRQLHFDLSGVTLGTFTTLKQVNTANRTLTLPDATDTLVGKATTDVFTNKSLSDTTCKIIDAADATKILNFNVGGTTNTNTTFTTAQTANRTITLPDATDTLVGKATTDVLTNKTVSGGTLTTCTISGTTTLASSSTFSGVLSLPSGSTIRFASGVSAADFTLKTDNVNGFQIYDWTNTSVAMNIASSKVGFLYGITLPTSGGTASTVNYYEEKSYSMTANGIWATGQACTVKVVRINTMVNVYVTACSAVANTNAIVTLDTTLDNRFFPSSGSTRMPFSVFDNASVPTAGWIAISSIGVITIGVNSSTGKYAGLGSSGFYSGSVSYAA